MEDGFFGDDEHVIGFEQVFEVSEVLEGGGCLGKDVFGLVRRGDVLEDFFEVRLAQHAFMALE